MDNVAFEATPLMVNGVLYTSTSGSQVAAIEAGTGQNLWTYDPRSYTSGRPPNLGFLHRGVAYWTDGQLERIFIATGDARLLSLDAQTGRPDTAFGTSGIVDLEEGISRIQNGYARQYGSTSPPGVCRDVVIVGASIHDPVTTREAPRGDVRGFDARTGERLWTFRTIPQAGEAGNETWENGSWEYTGHANVWAPMSVDEELGLVYLPVGCATNDYYGGQRPGDNLYANSLVCLDAETGERVWHFQTTHHDVWDYDLGSAPNLVDITVDGVPIKAVAQVTKQGYTFVFNRLTGEPVWPIEEVAVPASNVPGEGLSPTQPRPAKPPPFVRQGTTIDDLIDTTPQTRQRAENLIDDFDWGPLFTPPSQRGTILRPGIGGGASWGGAAFDPETHWLYVTPLGTVPFLIRLSAQSQSSDLGFKATVVEVLGGPSGEAYLFKPPWGSITAIDLDKGELVWQVPNVLPNGVPGQTSALVTKTLLFHKNNSLRVLRIFDKFTGDPLTDVALPANITGAPMTYMLDGRQYVVVAVGAGAQNMELIAIALPEDALEGEGEGEGIDEGEGEGEGEGEEEGEGGGPGGPPIPEGEGEEEPPEPEGEPLGNEEDAILTLSFETSDFGAQPVGEPADLTFDIVNTGTGPLIGQASVTGPFAIALGSSYALPQNATHFVVVRFTPLADGPFEGTLTLTGGGGASVLLTGMGTNLPGGGTEADGGPPEETEGEGEGEGEESVSDSAREGTGEGMAQNEDEDSPADDGLGESAVDGTFGCHRGSDRLNGPTSRSANGLVLAALIGWFARRRLYTV